MRFFSIILLAAVAALAVVYCRDRQTARDQLTAVQEDLAATSNQMVVAQTGIAMTTTQMEARTVAAVDLQLKVAVLGEEKTQAEDRARQGQQTLEAAQRDLAQGKARSAQDQLHIEELELTRDQLMARAVAVSDQLQGVRGQLAALDRTHTGAVGELQALRERQQVLESENTSLAMERTSLEFRMNDLNTLRDQIRVVEKEQRQQTLAKRKARSAGAVAAGNRGFLVTEGEWTSLGSEASYP